MAFWSVTHCASEEQSSILKSFLIQASSSSKYRDTKQSPRNDWFAWPQPCAKPQARSLIGAFFAWPLSSAYSDTAIKCVLSGTVMAKVSTFTPDATASKSSSRTGVSGDFSWICCFRFQQ